MLLKARQFVFEFPRPVMMMGVINVTPDSFSDGGKFLDPQAATDHALRLEAEGAEILDIGGESTRPQAAPVPEAEELRRVLPVIAALAGKVKCPISIDTQKPAVARAALAAGAAIVNDIAAHRSELEMWEIVRESKAGYVAMHMQGTPQTMQANPMYRDVAGEVEAFFAERLRRLQNAGVAPEQVMLDVGIGFGKRLEHNLELLAALGRFTRQGRPLLLGVSRKSFMDKLLKAAPDARLPGGLACACWAAQSGASIIRTHDVAATVQAVRMLEAILSARR